MKSKKEIQEKLGIKFEYVTRKSYIEDIDKDISKKYLVLSKEDKYKIMDLRTQALQEDDLETARLCNSIFKEQFNRVAIKRR